MVNNALSARPVIFGEVLWDCFPDGQRMLGGAPFNVAWHLQAFGAAPLLVSAVGNDAAGDAILAAMQQWQMDTSAVQRCSNAATGTVQVVFRNSEPHYTITHPAAWDDIRMQPLSLPPTAGAVLYHGSLALRDAGNRNTLAALLAQQHNARFVDINLRAPWYRVETVSALLEGAQWIKLNSDELVQLTNAPGRGSDQDQLASAIDEFFARYQPEWLLLTLGERGALLIDRSGQREQVEPAEQLTVVDTVGAGDAFASVMLLGLLRRWPLRTALQRAQQFASAIVNQRGAVSQEPEFYRRFSKNWGHASVLEQGGDR